MSFPDARYNLVYYDFGQVWDRRSLSETNPQPVGVLAGHMDGITFIDTKVGDIVADSVVIVTFTSRNVDLIAYSYLFIFVFKLPLVLLIVFFFINCSFLLYHFDLVSCTSLDNSPTLSQFFSFLIPSSFMTPHISTSSFPPHPLHIIM